MSSQLTIDKKNSALLVIDYQNGTVGLAIKNNPGLLERASAVLQAAREVSLPIIYVAISFRAGYPEISSKPTTRVLAGIRASGGFLEGTPSAEIHAQVAPQPEDIVVIKRRAGAFSTTDLAAILKAKGINCLILMGISTSGAVLSTVRWAADLDYEQIVVEDACGDFDEEVHRVLTQKVFPVQATVVQSQELITALKA